MLFIMNLAKMSAFLFNCNEQWQLKQRLPEKQELRYANEIEKKGFNTYICISITTKFLTRYIFLVLFVNQVIAAEGEQKASHSLMEAAKVISESPSALQVNLKHCLFLFRILKISTLFLI